MKNLLLAAVLALVLSKSAFADGSGGDILRATVMVDKLEYQFNDEKATAWESYAYVGYDLNKIYIYSEGEKVDNVSSLKSENQLVYSRATTPYWDVQLGVAYDKTEESDKTWGVIGVQGLAPYFFEIRAVVLVGDEGNIGFRAEAEYEALFTQKLILTPSIEMEAYSKDNLEMGIGSGFSNLTLGARLRYEFVREFAPYIGIQWSKNFGNTDDVVPLDEVYITTGFRFWF
ncbi:MAG: copper resistance protein B [Sulfurimonas sp.]|uniref:copper resistance protein B n=1 Tax=Sulfurimonas sp. TaxID=2022749 RepID=UPI0025E99938|nr:copper resistance protein B [Sulfurimonas sp.]MCK9454270.1 copper resistance protein B [Sulfurimonas sp.]